MKDRVVGVPGRRAGLLVPLFACPSRASWGIGDIGDIALVTTWLAGAGQRVLQLLPLNEMAFAAHSPYSALSAMAIDPIFIRVDAVPEFAALGGERALDRAERESLSAARSAGRVDYPTVRRLKAGALSAAFERFRDAEWSRRTGRARALEAFVASQDWWIGEYSLFRAIHDREHNRPWTEWPESVRRREPSALDRARRDLADRILFYQYLQWIADAQWHDARAAARANGVELFGDLPFMVDGDSADVWARPEQFRLDASLGVPPDAFSASGQDWGMPVYRWDRLAADNFSWLRERARRSAYLYDGYRVDHLVGFYRTYARPHDGGKPVFTPDSEPEQLALGERVLAVFREAGAEIIAEDLGTVPGFVRASLARLGLPGFRVFRWERFWEVDEQPFRDPSDYPPVSVAASGTHDTETLVGWWEGASDRERQLVCRLPTIGRLTSGQEIDRGTASAAADAILEALFASGSDLLLTPIPDVFGWRDRINDPATADLKNWTFRLPWPCDDLAAAPEARERQELLRTWAERHGR